LLLLQLLARLQPMARSFWRSSCAWLLTTMATTQASVLSHFARLATHHLALCQVAKLLTARLPSAPPG
jgi:hypothetical protein